MTPTRRTRLRPLLPSSSWLSPFRASLHLEGMFRSRYNCKLAQDSVTSSSTNLWYKPPKLSSRVQRISNWLSSGRRSNLTRARFNAKFWKLQLSEVNKVRIHKQWLSQLQTSMLQNNLLLPQKMTKFIRAQCLLASTQIWRKSLWLQNVVKLIARVKWCNLLPLRIWGNPVDPHCMKKHLRTTSITRRDKTLRWTMEPPLRIWIHCRR